MKIIVIGANGTIGKSVVNKLETHHEVIKVGYTSGDYQLDITSESSITQMFEDIKNIDAVVSVTGKAAFKPLSELDSDSNEIAIRSKLLGQINLVLIGQHYLNDNGSFTLTSGIMMDDSIECGSSAAMANSGVASFVKSSAIELKRGLRINNVSPNLVEESVDIYGNYFKGFTPVPVDKVANAYVKSIEGLQTGQTYRIYQ